MNKQQLISSNSTATSTSSRALLATAALIAIGGIGVGLGAVVSADTDTPSPATELAVSEDSTAPADTDAEPTGVTEASTPAATNPVATPAPIETAAAPAPAPLVTPEALRGTWREVDGSPITADDCAAELPINFGRILTISESGFALFETGGELIDVHEAGSLHIEATYDTTYADTPTQDRITFDAPGDGDVVIMSGDDRPGPTQYVRCPA